MKYEGEGVNVEELGLYLSVSLKEDDLMEAGIARYCLTRKSNRGRPSNITGSVSWKRRKKKDLGHGNQRQNNQTKLLPVGC